MLSVEALKLSWSQRIALGWKNGLNLAFEVTNNEVDYEALIYGLALARHLSIKKLKVRGDSAVVVGHMNVVYEVKEP